MIRVWLIAGGLLLAALAWQTHRANSAVKANAILTVQRDAARWQVEQEQKARQHEQEIAKNASNQFQRTVTSLQNELAARPLGPVIVRVRNHPVLPEANGPAGAASGPDDSSPGRESGTAEVDIERPITAYGYDCAKVAAQLDALQGWVRAR